MNLKRCGGGMVVEYRRAGVEGFRGLGLVG